MTPDRHALYFRSDLFAIDPREDEETNPYCYGKALAEWVRVRFQELGYQPEPVFGEDFGWCVMLARSPFMPWIVCGNARDEYYRTVTPEQKESFVPDGREVVWHCVVGTDVPFWTTFFWKHLFGRASTAERVDVVTRQLQGMLDREPRIRIVPRP